jgi:hypothetical protein
MATVTLDGTVNVDSLSSTSATYATARGGNVPTLLGASDGRAGQRFATPNYQLYETFLEFDSTGILVPGDTITAAVLRLYCRFDDSVTNLFAAAYVWDFGAAVTTGDWVPGATVAGLTKVAQLDSATVATSAYNSFADVNLPANVTKNGVTRLVLTSDRMVAATVPTVDEYLTFYAWHATNMPKLDITYTAAAAGGSYAGMLGGGMIG